MTEKLATNGKSVARLDWKWLTITVTAILVTGFTTAFSLGFQRIPVLETRVNTHISDMGIHEKDLQKIERIEKVVKPLLELLGKDIQYLIQEQQKQSAKLDRLIENEYKTTTSQLDLSTEASVQGYGPLLYPSYECSR